eukprot:CAMPEP_0204270956 /NCGR_PEP_ID=MMETSP0468-20130131/19189_1 /ASSEMBLY_ACC=CAM_ASM_000383 /TAXON_ID=2969 /ORGANISM="Oxyrrhis marina" /LENGTH=140 /DNA_ID=CAMNT_0051246555 /DNA_START=189 /DNA_END=611 /DNA_ORIENTATION=+
MEFEMSPLLTVILIGDGGGESPSIGSPSYKDNGTCMAMPTLAIGDYHHRKAYIGDGDAEDCGGCGHRCVVDVLCLLYDPSGFAEMCARQAPTTAAAEPVDTCFIFHWLLALQATGVLQQNEGRMYKVRRRPGAGDFFMAA